MRESEIQAEILRVIGSRPDVRLWRNNTGAGVLVDPTRLAGEIAAATNAPAFLVAGLIKKHGRFTRFGVPGAPDTDGILRGGRRFGVEVKSESGRQTEEQKNYQAMIERFGGLYVLARSVDDVLRVLP